ncbi:MAG: hypothetical protein ACFBSE_27450 [Prochloraceae cyanobacterium]
MNIVPITILEIILRFVWEAILSLIYATLEILCPDRRKKYRELSPKLAKAKEKLLEKSLNFGKFFRVFLLGTLVLYLLFK